jgi:iron only hydrogenase large subunit-like protein
LPRSLPSGAIRYYDSTSEARALLESPRKVAALVSPGISGEFDDITDYRKFVRMLLEAGFDYVHEAAFGVDLVAKDYNQLISNFLGRYYIFSNCPPVVAWIEKYYPHLLDNLAPIVSPMIAGTRVIRQEHGNDTAVVFIGPCIGAKEEALRYEDEAKVDAVLTFTELRQLFEEAGIKESTVEYSDFDGLSGTKAPFIRSVTGYFRPETSAKISFREVWSPPTVGIR